MYAISSSLKEQDANACESPARGIRDAEGEDVGEILTSSNDAQQMPCLAQRSFSLLHRASQGRSS
jgi:hypothetical protein